MALRSLALANAINIVLDPCMIFGWAPFPQLGVTGAAVATTIGRGTGVLYLGYYLLAGKGRLEFGLQHLRIVALYGSAPVAAYSIALRMIEFALLPAWGLGNAAATLVGQNLGADQPERAEKTVWRAARYNATFMLGVGICLIMAAPLIVALFSSDAGIHRYGTNCLRIMGLGYPMYAVGMIIIQAFKGAGDTLAPTVLNFICFWLIQIPLAYTLEREWEWVRTACSGRSWSPSRC